MNNRFDVIVVGAGIVGLAHAYTAASRGLSVCVVERDAACIGASIRNFGFITVTGQPAGDTWRRAMRSRRTWAELAPQAGIQIVHRGPYLVALRPAAVAVVEAFLRTSTGERCELHDAQALGATVPALKLDRAGAVLYSPHELRVESRTAIPRLAAWLARALGVIFRWRENVLDIQTPRVRTSRGLLYGERVVLCPGADFNALYGSRFDRHALTICRLQMLRLQPEPGYRLPGAVMNDLSLVRYLGYADLPEARALRAQLEVETPECLARGIHLIAVQSADGSLVVGDSHHYGAAAEPFAAEQLSPGRQRPESAGLRAVQVRAGGPGAAALSSQDSCSPPRGAEPGHEQSGGLFVPGEGLGHWPSAACKAARGDRGPTCNAVDALILQQLHGTLALERAQVVERWVGTYPSSASEQCLIEAPDEATRIVVVTSGTGASTAFGIAEDVFASW